MRLDAQIGSLDIGDEEFIVLVPFTRASQQRSSTRTQSQEQGVNTSRAPEVTAAADSAWKDIMDDLSSIPTNPQSDAASKDLSSSVSCSEELTTCHGSSNRSPRKRRKTFKEDGNVPPESISSTVNGSSEKRNMSKKSGAVKSAASSCHVYVHSFSIYPYANFKSHHTHRRRKDEIHTALIVP